MTYLCLRQGDINPKTNRPDWCCGAIFNPNNNSTCNYHPGYENKEGFVCCGGNFENGCTEGSHETAEWPDARAKLYFYPKQILNPGIVFAIKGAKKELVDKEKMGRITRGKQMVRCFYFEETKHYDRAKERALRLKIKMEEEKDKTRICRRWGCENRLYTPETNSAKACLSHPGVWDHGHTASNIKTFLAEKNKSSQERKYLLWNSHWTCCSQEWNAKGCTLTFHSGPLEEVYKEKEQQYVWPDIRAKMNFKKVITSKWKNVMDRFILNEDQQKAFIKSEFGKGVRN